MNPRISVVIPVRNSSETIGKCLESLTRLDHPSYEVIVVDDGSTDSTAAIVRSFEGIVLIQKDAGGPSRARNAGIEVSRGEFVAFTDGDCILEPQWLNELERSFIGPDVAGAGGDQQSPDDETAFGRSVQDFFKAIGFVTGYIKTDPRMKQTVHNPSCCSMYRKTVLREVGGFNESLFPGEDVELDLKITRRGYRLMFNPAAVVDHYRPATWSGFSRMMWRYGQCQGRLVRLHGPFRTIQYVPVILILAVLCLISVLSWKPEWWCLPILAVAIVCGWLVLKAGDLTKGAKWAVLAIITLAVWNSGYAVGLIRGVPES